MNKRHSMIRLTLLVISLLAFLGKFGQVYAGNEFSSKSLPTGYILPFEGGWRYTQTPHLNYGIDLAPPKRTACIKGNDYDKDSWVVAAQSGKVIISETAYVAISHNGGWVTEYIHIASTDRVKKGAVVQQGARIGHPSCETQWPKYPVTGVHLHFQLRDGTDYVSMMNWSLSGWKLTEYETFISQDGKIVVYPIIKVINKQTTTTSFSRKHDGVAITPTITSTSTPTKTHTPTFTPTPTSTFTSTFTLTFTPTNTFTFTPTITTTPTSTFTPTFIPTLTPTNTYLPSPTSSQTTTSVPTETFTLTPSATIESLTSTFTPTFTPSATETLWPSTNTPSPTPFKTLFYFQPTLNPSYTGNLCTAGWLRINGWQDKYSYLTLNTNQAEASGYTATYSVIVEKDGYYKVSNWVAQHDPIAWSCPTKIIYWDSSKTPFKVQHANGPSTVYIDQSQIADDWASVGTYYFVGGTTYNIIIFDLNNEADLSRTISVGTLRLEYTP